jgi:Coenzyme PQQ synthesis protein D (PqqD)
VHALNATAARVWQQCDGATSPEVIAAALHRDLAMPEAEAVVDLTLPTLRAPVCWMCRAISAIGEG